MQLKDKDFITAVFNPSNKDQFLVMSKGTLTFYTIIKAFKTSDEPSNEGDLSDISECERVSTVDFLTQNPQTQYLDCIWDGFNHVFISTDQSQIHYVDFNTGEERRVIDLESNCLKLTLTAKHLIASLENSMLKWYIAIMPDENKMLKAKGKDKSEVVNTDFKDEVT